MTREAAPNLRSISFRTIETNHVFVSLKSFSGRNGTVT